MNTKVIIIGAGASGIGVGVALKNLEIPFMILEREGIGTSFNKWPEQMRFISPSFTGNFFGMPDLNAITPDTSPAYTLQVEHPTGKQYAQYLNTVAKHNKLPIQKNCEVNSVDKQANSFLVKTNKGEYTSEFVIWAAGEFQYPNDLPFDGAGYCVHNSKIASWKTLRGNSFVVIGAYESGIDAAWQLAALGKNVTVLDSGDQLASKESDSSYSLSPFTRDRLLKFKSNIKIMSNSKVESVKKNGEEYVLKTTDGKIIVSKAKPILATGFVSSLSLVDSLFTRVEGDIQLTEHDESKKTPGFFLVGPQVKHGAAIFCFIYKYRQRFPVVAKAIATRLGMDSEAVIDWYKKMNFYLEDLSCCEDECAC